MVSFNRLCDKFLSGEIDSYYVISIDGKDNKICMFNLYEHLDYTNTNLGIPTIIFKSSQSQSLDGEGVFGYFFPKVIQNLALFISGKFDTKLSSSS